MSNKTCKDGYAEKDAPSIMMILTNENADMEIGRLNFGFVVERGKSKSEFPRL
jgi:hypothetical protein